jgi:predicted phage terminase large subunit-like protein
MPCDAAPPLSPGYDTLGRITVRSVEKSLRQRDRLYNIEVADNNNYFASGVLVHNCDHLVYVSQGDIRFLNINLPPRHTKSLIASVLWPVWDWLHTPGRQFLTASVDDRLALDFARLSRRVIESPWFQQFYGEEFYLLPDENQGRQYRNDKGGQRVATSVQGRVTGSGGDIQVLDDAHSAKKVESDKIRQASLEWHDNEWRSRLNNPRTAQKVYVGQRTHDSDIYGHVMAQEGKRWVNLALPVEFDPKRRCITFLNDGTGVPENAKPIFEDPRQQEGEMLQPSRFDADSAAAEKGIMSDRAWNAQYQQQPEGSGGLILKRHWWKQWVYPEWHETKALKEMPMPEFFEVIQVYDTAFEADEEADFSARTTWGLFNHRENLYDIKTKRHREGKLRTCAMLLDMMNERMEYPALRSEVLDSYDAFQPEWVLIEKKASGHSLLQELRKKGIPCKAVRLDGSSGRGRGSGDLIARAHESSLMLEKGCIYYVPRNWAFTVIEQCAKFPAGDHDDLVSTCTMAWQYMRRYYDLTLSDDEEQDEVKPFSWAKAPRYA